MITGEQRDAIQHLLAELHHSHTNATRYLSQLQNLVAEENGQKFNADAVPIMDDSNHSVCWGNRRCRLGPTISFRLLKRLMRRLNHYVTCDHLVADVWNNRTISELTVRSAIRQLKKKLIQADMPRLADSIRSAGKQYGLMIAEN